jgi:hypothetical protein
MSRPTTEELARRIEAAMEKVKAEGWTVKDGVWIDPPDRACCPQGACLIADNIRPEGLYDSNDDLSYSEWAGQVAAALGATRDWVDGFAMGFDGSYFGTTSKDTDDTREGYVLGRLFRRKLGLPFTSGEDITPIEDLL